MNFIRIVQAGRRIGGGGGLISARSIDLSPSPHDQQHRSSIGIKRLAYCLLSALLESERYKTTCRAIADPVLVAPPTELDKQICRQWDISYCTMKLLIIACGLLLLSTSAWSAKFRKEWFFSRVSWGVDSFKERRRNWSHQIRDLNPFREWEAD